MCFAPSANTPPEEGKNEGGDPAGADSRAPPPLVPAPPAPLVAALEGCGAMGVMMVQPLEKRLKVEDGREEEEDEAAEGREE